MLIAEKNLKPIPAISKAYPLLTRSDSNYYLDKYSSIRPLKYVFPRNFRVPESS